MDTTNILHALRAERERLNQAINALEALDGKTLTTQTVHPTDTARKRNLSAAARRRISEASKKRWARQKAQAAKRGASAKHTAPKPTSPMRGMSTAARQRISEMMKRRWAARKKAAAKAA